MTPPPLYKFLSIEGAKATLRTRTFRHAKPSTFNDVEDLTIQSLFPDDVETTLQKIGECLPAVILKHVNDVPTCEASTAEGIAELQAAYRATPDAAKIVDAEFAKTGVAGLYNLDAMRALATDMLDFVNKFMQDYRVFCVTKHRDSEKMWNDYAGKHSGIALCVEPSIERDSHLRLFRPVDYRERRPPLYKDAEDFSTNALFGDKDAHVKALIENIVYTKTLNWNDEGEYRVVGPFDGPSDEPWDVPFHPEEIAELYLGYKMRVADLVEIIKLAKAANPSIAIFQVERTDDCSLGFRRLPAVAW